MPQTTSTPEKSADIALRGLTETERDQIRRRAHAIWREEGYPQGRDRAHWEMAELQVLKGRRSY
ncbi:DUF2934 domain-containing protein [Xanthobacter dioxanivorans]|uniref:DUF2934 domain-containing protein n=1 Tax=Xanthobacter dioxanivorans TaxID=2528964 RepID=A0A974PK10_9HYPH|nr:DUF2934 domain-containing protein [Xanthobacter dioxanivorans]QRG04949.1 DUF2934 domain-containing protein [Xanthobacter dioxanivorans]